jgi:hypothetical protein
MMVKDDSGRVVVRLLEVQRPVRQKLSELIHFKFLGVFLQEFG